MQLDLKKRPQNPIIIEGFPGLGLVATIATGFLVEHIDAEPIGRIWAKELMPVIAIHDSKVVEPLEIYYSKKYNLVILNALSNIQGLEWDLADQLVDLADQLKAKEIISVEGINVGGFGEDGKQMATAYYFSNDKKRTEQFEKAKVKKLKEGVAMGVTAALLLKKKNIPNSCIFVETNSTLPDSRAAAKIIEVLDSILNLKIDYKPIIKKADEFETKLKGLLEQNKVAIQHKKNKELSYFG